MKITKKKIVSIAAVVGILYMIAKMSKGREEVGTGVEEIDVFDDDGIMDVNFDDELENEG